MPRVMLNKAITNGHIKGILEELISRGISHIQYVDNTIIMINPLGILS